MAVMIKDMDMPSCCLSCRFYMSFIGISEPFRKCIVNNTIFHPMVNVAVRVKDCPLVPIEEIEEKEEE